MSRGFALAIGLGAATSWPSSAPPGSLLLGESGGIAGRVALVDASGTPYEVVPPASSFVPPNDNATDLGDASHRFRSLWLGTSIENAGDLAVRLSGSATRVFSVTNPTGGQSAQIVTDGNVVALGALITSAWTNAGNAEIDLAAGSPRTLTIHNSGSSVCDVVTDGVIAPLTDNAQDLGKPDTGGGRQAWRSLFLGQSIEAGDALGITLSANGTSQLNIQNPVGGNVCNLYLDGGFQIDGRLTFGQNIGGEIHAGFLNTGLKLWADGNGEVALRNTSNTATIWGVRFGGLTVYSDVQLGPGPTVDRPAGVVRVQNGGATVIVANNLVRTAPTPSMILATIQAPTTNPVSVLSVEPGAGVFTITLSGDPGVGGADVAFLVVNASS